MHFVALASTLLFASSLTLTFADAASSFGETRASGTESDGKSPSPAAEPSPSTDRGESS